jgi:hypothetical protein
MPKVTVETLLGYRFAINRLNVPEIAEDGHPLHNGHGEPKTTEITRMVIFDDTTGHQIVMDLQEELRAQLVELLTGGILVPGFRGPGQ